MSDVGSNGSISEKNREYCELTVQYYAWKNEDLGGYGFCHYRRFFCFDDSVKAPYIIREDISENEYAKLFKSQTEIEEMLSDYDIVTVRPEKTAFNVKEYYCRAAHHYKEDLESFIALLKKMYPQFSKACDTYLNQKYQYFCNMFIMSRECFFDYCGVLFSVLEEFDKTKQLHGDFQSDRTDGYLGERFLGIYITYARSQNKSIKELPRIDTHCTAKKKILYKLLPPQSPVRLILKRIVSK